jgi:hypothetical protein
LQGVCLLPFACRLAIAQGERETMGARELSLFESLYKFREKDLLTKEQYESYKAMLILLRMQYQQQKAMLDTALQHNKANRYLIQAWNATEKAIADIELLFKMHTLATNHQKDEAAKRGKK